MTPDMYLKRFSAVLVYALLASIAGGAAAQTTAPPAGYAVNAQELRHQELARLMEQMQISMKNMAEQMKQKDITREMRKDMAAQMKAMSSMMRRASHVLVGPGTDPEVRKELETMRREMARMPDMRRQHDAPAAGKR